MNKVNKFLKILKEEKLSYYISYSKYGYDINVTDELKIIDEDKDKLVRLFPHERLLDDDPTDEIVIEHLYNEFMEWYIEDYQNEKKLLTN